MTSMEEVLAYLRSDSPLIWVTSSERQRVEKEIVETVKERAKVTGGSPLLLRYTAVNTVEQIDDQVELQEPSSPQQAIELHALLTLMLNPQSEIADDYTENAFINKLVSDTDQIYTTFTRRGAIILVDSIDYLMKTDRVEPRWLATHFDLLQRSNIFLIGIAPSFTCADGSEVAGVVRNLFSVVDYHLPTYQELENILSAGLEVVRESKTIVLANEDQYSELAVERAKQLKVDYTKNEIHEIVRAAQGMTALEFASAIRYEMKNNMQITARAIMEKKTHIIKKSQILELIPTETLVDDVGGLDELKSFFETWRDCLSEAAEEYGVETPRGCIMFGVPGVGKSLFAKAVANLLGLPLVRLDVGKILHGIVGSSEARARDVVKTLEALGPSVCMMDEVEKAIAGTSSSDRSDSGVMARVFGTFLTAMQEGMKDTIIVATSNNIEQIPPEFIRRFEEVFFVDLPNHNERKDVFRIHLQKRKRQPEQFDLERLAEESEGYTGAEIEKVVRRSIAKVFAEAKGKRQITDEDLINTLKEVTPISSLMRQQIDKLRSWAKSHGAKRANSSGEHVQRAKPKKSKVTEDITKVLQTNLSSI